MQRIIFIFFLLLLTGCSTKKVEVEPLFVVYPYDFYEKFNLRTIISSYRTRLQYYCGSYPKDFFKQYEIRVANDKFLVLDDGDRTLSFEMVAYNQVIITDSARESEYKSTSLYTFYYNTEEDDFRADEFYVKKEEDCKVYKKGKFKIDSNKIIKKSVK